MGVALAFAGAGSGAAVAEAGMFVSAMLARTFTLALTPTLGLLRSPSPEGEG